MLPRRLSGKESACRCRRLKRHGSDPWVGQIPWKRKWQLTPVFLPGESRAQRSLAGCSPQGRRVGRLWAAELRGGRRTRVFPAALQSLQHRHLPCAWPPGRRSEMSPVPCGMPPSRASWGLCCASLGTTLPRRTEYSELFCPGRGRDFHRQINIVSLRSDTVTLFQHTYSGILLKALHPSQLCRELAL